MQSENELTEKIIGAAIEVHRHLGPGLLESAYEECLCFELNQMGLQFQRQVQLPVHYKGVQLKSCHNLKMDLVVEDAVVVEIKATEETAQVHCAQLLTYLKFSGKHVGPLSNFNVPILKSGLKRIVNHYSGPALPYSSPRVSPFPRVSASSISLDSNDSLDSSSSPTSAPTSEDS